MRRVSIGVVGTGAIAERAHLPILSEFKDVKIEAICDASPDRLKRRSAEWDIPKTYTDYREMLRSLSLDAVLVCVPTFLHYDVIRLALEEGTHVFCEKPMGVSARRARELVDLATKKSLVLGVGYNKRLNDSYAQARRMLREQRFGNIIQAHATLMTAGPYVDWIASSDWFFDEKGGGVLYDLVPHLIDLWNYVLEERTVEVGARATSSRKSLDIPDNVTCTLKTANGVIGTVSVGWGAGASTESITIHGSGGSFIACPLGFSQFYGKVNPLDGGSGIVALLKKLILSRSANVNPFKGVDETYVRQDRAFVDSIVNGMRPSASGEDALRVLEVVEAMKLSLEEGRSVRIEEISA